MGEEKRQPDTLQSAVADIQAMGGKAEVACDLADLEARKGLIERASAFFGADRHPREQRSVRDHEAPHGN